MRKISKLILPLLATALVVVVVASCGTPKNITYMVDVENIAPQQMEQYAKIYEAKIMPKDVLTISVNTTVPEAGAPFNLGSNIGSMVREQMGGSYSVTGSKLQTYVVDNEGNINYPIVGKINLMGLTRNQAQEHIKTLIHPAFITEEPIINVRFDNYKVSVLGEVSRPGQFTVDNEQCTLFDALALAGDLTIYGRRDNIMLIRENENGKKLVKRINLQQPEQVLDPEHYYLKQNDVIYVEPNHRRAKDSQIGQAERYTLSLVSTLVSVTTLIMTIIRLK